MRKHSGRQKANDQPNYRNSKSETKMRSKQINVCDNSLNSTNTNWFWESLEPAFPKRIEKHSRHAAVGSECCSISFQSLFEVSKNTNSPDKNKTCDIYFIHKSFSYQSLMLRYKRDTLSYILSIYYVTFTQWLALLKILNGREYFWWGCAAGVWWLPNADNRKDKPALWPRWAGHNTISWGATVYRGQ